MSSVHNRIEFLRDRDYQMSWEKRPEDSNLPRLNASMHIHGNRTGRVWMRNEAAIGARRDPAIGIPSKSGPQRCILGVKRSVEVCVRPALRGRHARGLDGLSEDS